MIWMRSSIRQVPFSRFFQDKGNLEIRDWGTKRLDIVKSPRPMVKESYDNFKGGRQCKSEEF